jgi:C4-dicarboxylate transporter DctM subunit
MFIDAMALLMLLVPIISPILTYLKLDLIWFGVIIVLLIQAGVITPPVGVNVFVVKGIAIDTPLEVIFKGIFPFLVALIACIVIVLFFPQIATFLPSLITR